MKVILQAIEYIKQGVSMWIFPEGTRNTGEELSLLPFKEGSFKIALKTGCPIVPVAINNTADILESHFPILKKNHVIIEYGTPIYPNELSRDEQKVIGATCQNIISEMLVKNAKDI
jgi:1-acyl-sn-glycerol-3-phosphate acyltransferase